MVNLFRLLGLPNPNATPKEGARDILGATEPGPKPGNKFHDLGESRWSERTERISERPSRRVLYMQPDGLHRLHLEGIEGNLSMGDMVIVNLKHMPSQQSVCSRRVKDLGERTGLPVFALNEDDSLLMIAGSRMRVDTQKHKLGTSSSDWAIQN